MKSDRYYIYVFALVVAFFSWLAFYLGEHMETWLRQSEAIVGGIWSMITTIMVFQAIYDNTIQAGYQRILGAFVGALISVVICTLFGYGVLQMIGSIFLSRFAIKIIKIEQAVRISAATAGVITAHGLSIPEITPWVAGIIRFFTTVIGALLAIMGSYLLKWLWNKITR